MYALNIDIPYDGKRKSCMRAIIIKLHPSCINHKQIQRATGKTAKLHCFCVYAINIYTPCKGKGDKVLKAKQPFFLACTLEKTEGPRLKLHNYTGFVCIPYILILLVLEMVIISWRLHYTKFFYQSSNFRGSRGKTTKIHCFCVHALYIDTPCDAMDHQFL